MSAFGVKTSPKALARCHHRSGAPNGDNPAPEERDGGEISGQIENAAKEAAASPLEKSGPDDERTCQGHRLLDYFCDLTCVDCGWEEDEGDDPFERHCCCPLPRCHGHNTRRSCCVTDCSECGWRGCECAGMHCCCTLPPCPGHRIVARCRVSSCRDCGWLALNSLERHCCCPAQHFAPGRAAASGRYDFVGSAQRLQTSTAEACRTLAPTARDLQAKSARHEASASRPDGENGGAKRGAKGQKQRKRPRTRRWRQKP